MEASFVIKALPMELKGVFVMVQICGLVCGEEGRLCCELVSGVLFYEPLWTQLATEG
jgi:hypothetical protein